VTTYLLHNGNGRAVSIGTVLADPMPDGLTVVPLSADDAALVRTGKGRWDEQARAVVPVPPELWPATLDDLEPADP
jgi:hypothetical protein